jgi:hypothetical protein
MAGRFVFTTRILTVSSGFIRIYFSHIGFLTSKSYLNVTIRHSCRYYTDNVTISAKFDVEVNESLWAVPSAALWSCPPGCVPYRLSSQFAVNAIFTALLLLSGDVELNPGPVINHSLKFAVVNTHTSSTKNIVVQKTVVQKTAIVHSLINELALDCTSLTESWIKESPPDIIKLDPAPPVYNIFHTHRLHNRIGCSVALIAREELRTRQFLLSNLYSSCDALAVQLPSSSGRLNIITHAVPANCAFH